MGVVVRQGLKTMVVIYSMTIISVLASLFIYPLDLDLYGTLTYVNDAMLLFGSLVMLGIPHVSLRFYSYIKETYGSRHVLIAFYGVCSAIGLLLLVALLGPTKPIWEATLEGKSKSVDLADFFLLFIVGVYISAATRFFAIYASTYKRTAVPRMLENLTRLLFPALILAVLMNWIDAEMAVYGLVIGSVLILLSLIYFVHYLDPITRRKMIGWTSLFSNRDVRNYAIFSLVSTLGTSLVFKIDSQFVTTMIDTEMNGVYGIGAKIGNLLAIPMVSLMSILTPTISNLMHRSNLDEVSDIYRRSSVLLSVIGSVMILGLLLIIDDLFQIIPNGGQVVAGGGVSVILFIAAGRFVDMVTSANTPIIVFSTYYKVNLYLLLSLAVMNTIANLLLIPIYGIVGAAVASFISLFIYNAVKAGFIYYRFSMWPFDHRLLMVIVIAMITFFIVDLATFSFAMHPVVSMGIRSVLAVSIFGFLCLQSGVSEDVTRLYHTGQTRIRSLLSS